MTNEQFESKILAVKTGFEAKMAQNNASLMANMSDLMEENLKKFGDMLKDRTDSKESAPVVKTEGKAPTASGSKTKEDPTLILKKIGKIDETGVKESSKFAGLKEVENKIVGAPMFKQRFLDYLDCMGLKAVLQSLRIDSIDLTEDENNTKEIEELHEAKVAVLLANPESEERWKRAHRLLKTKLEGALYQNLVVQPSNGGENENFFTLWDRLNRLIGGTGNQLEVGDLSTKWEELTLNEGERLSGLLSRMDEITGKITTITGQEAFTVTQKNAKLNKATANFDIFKQARMNTTGKLTSTEWKKTKSLFMQWVPRSTDDRTELPCYSEEEPPIANFAGKRPRSRPKDWNQQERCEYCNIIGHTIDVCRKKNYTGTAYPNKDCRQWVTEGSCRWKTNSKNRTGGACKFEHNPTKRNTGNWSPAPRRNNSNNTSNNNHGSANVSDKQEMADSQKKQFEQLTGMLTAAIQTAITGTMKNKEAGTMPEDPTAGLVEIPIGWSGSCTNKFEPLLTDDDMPELNNSDSSDSESESDNQEIFIKQKDKPRKQKSLKRKKNLKWVQKKSQPTVEAKTQVIKQPRVEAKTQVIKQVKQKGTKLMNIYKFVVYIMYTLLALTNITKQQEPKQGETHNAEERKEKGGIILDTGCSNSTTTSKLKKWLTNILPTQVKMMTANKGESIAKEKGQLELNGLNINVLHVDNFSKTLISYSDLADLGVTGVMKTNEIELFFNNKKWTTVTRKQDRLWHFTEAEEHYI